MSAIEEGADALIHDFDAWFRRQGNEPLVGSEKSIVKTFIWYLINVSDRSTIPVVEDKKKDAAPEGSMGG